MSSELQNIVDQFLGRWQGAWDSADARGYGSLSTDDAPYAIYLGEVLMGRAQIERNHIDVFGRWLTVFRMVVTSIDAGLLTAEVCSLLTIGGIGEHHPIRYDKIQTVTFVRNSGQWRWAAFHNRHEPVDEEPL